MDFTATLKRAPKWAWLTAAGIGVGAAGIHVYKNRAANKTSTPAATTDAGGVTTDTTNFGASSTSAPGSTIVPPVIIQPSQDNSSGDPSLLATGLEDLQNLYVGGVQNLITSYQDVWGPVQTANLNLLGSQADTIASLARAGSAPNSGGTTPTPDPLMQTPVPQVPVPVSLPQTNGVTSGHTPAIQPRRKCATAPYNNESPDGSCYAVVVSDGKGKRAKGRYHVYQDGHEVKVSA